MFQFLTILHHCETETKGSQKQNCDSAILLLFKWRFWSNVGVVMA